MGSEFSSILRPAEMSAAMINDGTNSGFQGSHMLGKFFYNNQLAFLQEANLGLSGGSQLRLGPNLKYNGLLQPEHAADSMWMQVAGHNQPHVDQFNELALSNNPNQPQFFNVIQAQVRELPNLPEADANAEGEWANVGG